MRNHFALFCMMLLAGCAASATTEVAPATSSVKSKVTEVRPSTTLTTKATVPQNQIAQSLGDPIFQVEHVKTVTGGTITTEEEASGQGAGLNAHGDKIVSDFKSTAPGANLGDGRMASGGDTASASKITSSDSLWSNPLMWAGILCLIGAGASVYLRLPAKVSLVAGVVGAAMVAAALYPAVMLMLVVAAVAVLVVPYIHTEWKHQKTSDQASAYKESLRAVVGGVAAFGQAAKDATNPTVPPEMYERLKSYIGAQASAADSAVIAEIKRADAV